MRDDPYSCLPRYRPRLHVRIVLWLMGWPMTPFGAYRAGHRYAEDAVRNMIGWREDFLGSDAEIKPGGYTRSAAQADLHGLNVALCELQNHSMPVKP